MGHVRAAPGADALAARSHGKAPHATASAASAASAAACARSTASRRSRSVSAWHRIASSQVVPSKAWARSAAPASASSAAPTAPASPPAALGRGRKLPAGQSLECFTGLAEDPGEHANSIRLEVPQQESRNGATDHHIHPQLAEPANAMERTGGRIGNLLVRRHRVPLDIGEKEGGTAVESGRHSRAEQRDRHSHISALVVLPQGNAHAVPRHGCLRIPGRTGAVSDDL
jgi:hypothetical protein